MNEVRHHFSLVAIKDTFNQYPSRFLLRYNQEWDCDLFFSFKTITEDESKNIANIRERLSNLLKIDQDDITVKYREETIQSKFSYKDKVNKVYDHKLYSATIKNFPENEKQDTFSIDGVTYRWLTIDDMKKDPNMQKKNSDVIDFVNTNIV